MKMRPLGFIFLGVSLCILAGYGLYHFVKSLTIPFIVKIAILGLVVGIVCILVSLIRERLKEVKNNHSKYK
ncbi:MAG: hypothetical protein U9O41_00260 [Candidatus Aerophobetes bacterium]|nr:hypothetical protein [Candidatus Aerophobetes bacterium]